MKPYNNTNGFTFGCDPELFIVDGEGNVVSPHSFLPGTKEEPFAVPCGAVQVDGFAAEFNITPVSTFEEFDNNIVTVMRELKKFLPKDHKFQITPTAIIPENVFYDAPESSKALGCSPDLNAWTGDVNPPPVAEGTNQFLRTAAGHIHIGWVREGEPLFDMTNTQHVLNCQDLVKQLDWFLGGWSLSKDKDNIRRQLYGKAGAMRIKPYGVEYRVLSNFWLTSKDLRLQTWNRMMIAIDEMRGKYLPDFYPSALNTELVQSINQGTISTMLADQVSYPIRSL